MILRVYRIYTPSLSAATGTYTCLAHPWNHGTLNTCKINSQAIGVEVPRIISYKRSFKDHTTLPSQYFGWENGWFFINGSLGMRPTMNCPLVANCLALLSRRFSSNFQMSRKLVDTWPTLTFWYLPMHPESNIYHYLLLCTILVP